MVKKVLVPIQLPADPTQPLEAATKQYVDTHVTDVVWVGPSAPVDPTVELWYDTDEVAAPGLLYVAKGGDTMTGPLVLAADPTVPLGAATKQYVDALSFNVQTGTTYTLVLSDLGKMVTLGNAAAITLTVPTNATVAFPAGSQIHLLQTGAGKVTAAGAGGVSVVGTPSLGLRATYSAATLINITTDSWVLTGDLA